MNTVELTGEVRELIGNPTPTEVSQRQLIAHLIPAIEWLATELRYDVREDPTGFGLVESVQEYDLPPDCLWVSWLSWDDRRLEPKNTFGWDRDGTIWRGRDNVDTLTEYAIQGRKLILIAPPSSDLIDTDPFINMRYIAAPPQLTAAGIVGLSEADQYLAVLRAAIRYCRSHPTDENNARVQNYSNELVELLPQAKRRATIAVEDFAPSFHVDTGGRTGGAR